MNICIINIDSHPQFIGGIKRVCTILANNWLQMGHNVFFICLCDNDVKYDNVSGIPQIHFPNPRNIDYVDNREFLKQKLIENQVHVVLNPFMNNKEVTRFCISVCKESCIKLVTAWHFSPTHFTDIVDNSFFVPLKLGNPIKRYLIDSLLWIKWRMYRRHQVVNLWRTYFRECVDKSDKVVLLSDKYIPVVEKYLGYHSDNIIAVNNPVVFEKEKNFSGCVRGKSILWIGRLGYDAKRTDKMISIWSRISERHPDWELIVCGSGNVAYFENICRKKKIKNILFSGFCDPSDYYKKASILCNTSIAEGWGLVLIEAMQNGCVPLAFDSYASVHDIIDDGKNGFIIPSFDERKYAEKLEILMNDETLRNTMASNGEKNLSKFSQESIAQQWIRLFQDVLENENNVSVSK